MENRPIWFQPATARYHDEKAIYKDLNIQTIVRGMALNHYEDEAFIEEILLRPLTGVEDILARQKVVEEACQEPKLMDQFLLVIKEASDKLEPLMDTLQDARDKNFLAETQISAKLDALSTVVEMTWKIRELIENNPQAMSGPGLGIFRETFYREVPPETIVEQRELVENFDAFKRKGEISLQGEMGPGFFWKNMKVLGVSSKAKKVNRGLFFTVDRRDVLIDEELYESAVDFTNQVLVDILDQCMPYIKKWQGHIRLLRKQIAFLAGCARMYNHTRDLEFQFVFPNMEEKTIKGLYDLSLALQTHSNPVSNSLEPNDYEAIIVTGANQGGKSTFLRSMGIGQVMCQAGMYVAAGTFPLKTYGQIFTHFTRREDASMTMGKFEEELKRMQDILVHAKRGSLILLNESFATTTEVTAYQIATDLLRVCLEEGLTLWMVTHITTFARQMYQISDGRVLFLSAGREANHEQRYSMVEKEPENTSYGLELYDQIISGKE